MRELISLLIRAFKGILNIQLYIIFFFGTPISNYLSGIDRDPRLRNKCIRHANWDSRLHARYNHASKNVYAPATNFISDCRNYSTHDAISASALVRELSKDVNTSWARTDADATAHYRNRRFYWLRVKLYAMVKENELKRWRETRNGGRERETASYHLAVHGKVSCLIHAEGGRKNSFGYLIFKILNIWYFKIYILLHS